MIKNHILSRPHSFKKFRNLFGDSLVYCLVGGNMQGGAKVLNSFRKKKKYFRYSFTSCL